MAGVNKVILVGNLGADPELRYAASGAAVATFNVATSETRKSKDTGERETKTEWHRVVAFNKLAEICGEYLHKGKQVYLEGKIQTRQWEKDGQKQYTTEIVVNEMQMLGSRGDSPNVPSGGGGGQQRGPQGGGGAQEESADFDDIPF